MKKFIILSLFVFFIIALHANGACLLQDLKNKNTCTGGAANINPDEIELNNENVQKQELKKMYQIPTMALPKQFGNDGFPALNQNCMFGACFPDFK